MHYIVKYIELCVVILVSDYISSTHYIKDTLSLSKNYKLIVCIVFVILLFVLGTLLQLCLCIKLGKYRCLTILRFHIKTFNVMVNKINIMVIW